MRETMKERKREKWRNSEKKETKREGGLSIR